MYFKGATNVTYVSNVVLETTSTVYCQKEKAVKKQSGDTHTANQ